MPELCSHENLSKSYNFICRELNASHRTSGMTQAVKSSETFEWSDRQIPNIRIIFAYININSLGWEWIPRKELLTDIECSTVEPAVFSNDWQRRARIKKCSTSQTCTNSLWLEFFFLREFVFSQWPSILWHWINEVFYFRKLRKNVLFVEKCLLFHPFAHVNQIYLFLANH